MGQTLSTQLKAQWESFRKALTGDEPLDKETKRKLTEFLRAYPQALFWKDQQGETLIMALFYYLSGALENRPQQSLDDFKCLLASPHTSRVCLMQNGFGCTLLHHACHHAPNNMEIISFLLDKDTVPATVLNQWEQTPLHVACIHGACLSVVRRLVEACPKAVVACDIEGQTPLHDACKHRAPLEVIRFLAMEELNVCLTPDEDGELPLDLVPKGFTKDEGAIEFLTSVTNAAAGAVTDELCKNKLRRDVLGPVATFLHDGLSEEVAIAKLALSKSEIYAMTRGDDIRANILARMAA